MNERIRELAEQAGIKLIPMIVDGVEYDYEDVEMDGSEDLAKFAELIVKECLLKVNGAKIRGESMDELIARIKEDFGVE